MARVKYVEARGHSMSVMVGTTSMDVRAAIGVPDHKPCPNIWIYHRFSADRDEVNQLGCSNLVIVFDGLYVSHMRLVNDRAVALVIAQAGTEPSAIPRMLIASK